MRRFNALIPLIIAAILAGPPARAADPGADPEIQATITEQIEAFGKGDAAKAESFAAPGIKAMFPDAGAFLGMVQRSYAPLVHPRSTHFEPTVTTSEGSVQHVTVVDGEGTVWTAVYALQRLDGRWVVSGCVLVKSPETSARAILKGRRTSPG